MLFVFGYRASKIRSKKLSVLIHNSNQSQHINSCTVSVYFQQIVDKVCYMLKNNLKYNFKQIWQYNNFILAWGRL